MRIGLDVTALLGPATGVAAVTSALVEGLAARDDIELRGFAMSWRGRERLPEVVPPALALPRAPMPARPLRRLWRRVDHPSIRWWTGPVEVVHGPNYVVPPGGGAAELLTVHDLTFVRHPELCTADVLEYPALIRRALRRGAHVHAVSRFTAGEVLEAFGADGATASRVHVVPNGVTGVRAGDAGRGRVLAGVGDGDGDRGRYVLALGTVEPRKDLPSLVRAFDGVAARDEELHLVIAGPDGWGGAVDALASAMTASPHRRRMHRIGWVGSDDRADLFAGAAVFAYPSLYEGFGLPPLEAMSAGVPVVTTSAGALPETVGDAALVVRPGDAEALAAALDTLLAGGPEVDALIERGRHRTTAFSWDAMVSGLVDLYRNLAAP